MDTVNSLRSCARNISEHELRHIDKGAKWGRYGAMATFEQGGEGFQIWTEYSDENRMWGPTSKRVRLWRGITRLRGHPEDGQELERGKAKSKNRQTVVHGRDGGGGRKLQLQVLYELRVAASQ